MYLDHSQTLSLFRSGLLGVTVPLHRLGNPVLHRDLLEVLAQGLKLGVVGGALEAVEIGSV
jgi:hypothetical protein